MVDLVALGQRIREQRLKLGLKQQDIANALTLSAQAVSKWERGENAPDIAILPDLARILAVSVDWLLMGSQPHTDSIDATILCTSINFFAERSARMSSKSVATWMNGLFYTLTEAALQYGCVPIKYVGDGFLGFFSGADHSRRALQAALTAHAVVTERHLVVTLHRGVIYLGAIGHPDYSKPDITGDSVNTAFLTMAWVARHIKSGLGITEAVAETLEDHTGFIAHSGLSIKGLPPQTTIYEVPTQRIVVEE
ncbi:MAG: helix-turn-helix domain-containing protein [candidate division Zixibacteria bacterium]|nr:helix-turn-helix domain-containing protein [candidate division Zixibacteria bacterium]